LNGPVFSALGFWGELSLLPRETMPQAVISKLITAVMAAPGFIELNQSSGLRFSNPGLAEI
jgi:hypothetical protein